MSEEAQDDASRRGTPPEPTEQPHYGGRHDDSTNTSQIAQVTASAMPPAESGKWSCDVCTYVNFPLSRKCTMCRAPKPLLGEDIFRLQDGATALPAPDTQGAEAVADRLKPLRISSPLGHASASAAKWACPTCTFENWPKALKCAMCGAAPQAPPARAALGGADGCGGEAAERLWLQACRGVLEGSARCVEAYLAAGGDPARALSAAEVQRLNRASAFDAGHTLVHLAIRFQRQDILATLLSRISGGGPGLKRSPSYIAPDLAAALRRHVASSVKHQKGSFPCRYLTEFCTFSLPAAIEQLPARAQQRLLAELLDGEAQRTLEAEPPLINWGLARGQRSRLYALWNRSAGDCLPDAALQAAYGVADRHNALRAALAESLHHAHRSFYERWQAWERAQAAQLQYAPDEAQLRAEWARLVAAAARPGTALHQLHVFALAHVMRRPIVVYGVDVVNSFRGEALGFAGFQGIYLPLLWEPDFCCKSPLCLGYTRGHFSALVPMEPYSPRRAYICRDEREDEEEVTFLPLTDCEGKLLPVHFLTCDELADAEGVLRRWLSARGGGAALLARQALPARPPLQAQMLQRWLAHYGLDAADE